MTRTMLTKAAIVIGLSMAAQSAAAMDNPGAENRAFFAATLGKAEATTKRPASARQNVLSFSADRMLNRYEKAQMRLRSSQPRYTGNR